MYIIQIYSQKPTYITESWIFCHQLKFANLKEGFSSSHKWAFKKSPYKYWDQGIYMQFLRILEIYQSFADKDEKYSKLTNDYCTKWIQKKHTEYPNEEDPE